LDKGEWLRLAFEAEPITDGAAGRDDSSLQEQNRNNEETPGDGRCEQQATVQVVATVDQEDSCKRNLINTVAEMGTRLPWQDKSKLQALFCEHHSIFVLEDGERGGTGVVQMEINTRDSEPKRQPARLTPFAARQEIAHQLCSMQGQGIIQPSSSPW